MKKQLLLITCAVLFASTAFGGGIVTNSNQSAYWVRTMVRDAAIGADAVYFNPAGLTRLEDGFHFSLSSQTIFQSKDVTNDYQFLRPTPKKYLGDVKAPVFPSFYATWKKNKIAISFGFNPIGGGGGAVFEDGLPSFEQSVADMVPTLNALGSALGVTATDYRRDVYFKGTSVYFGYQLGVTYQITDVISAYLGARYVSVKNTYEGHLKDVEVNLDGTWTNVSDAFDDFSTQYAGLAAQATAGATGATGIATTMGALIGGGLPSAATLADAETAGAITALERATIEAGLTAMGINITQGLGDIQTDCTDAAVVYTTQAGQATFASGAAADGRDATALTFDQQADVVQKGWGMAPVIGVNLAFDKLNIGMKYEFKTTIDVENDTKSGFIVGFTDLGAPIDMFEDGAKISNDMPAMFSIGANYKVTPKLSAAGGFHYYWDKGVSYGKTDDEHAELDNKDIMDHNYWELALGLEYGIGEKLLISAGYLLAQTGVTDDYQSDLSYSLSSSTLGGGLGYKLTDKLLINAGVSYSIYKEGEKTYLHTLEATGQEISTTDTFFKNTLILAIGLDFSF
jgi:long-subunit fatty acid transport protein